MKKSVEENKGFYIGRYETGIDENNKAVVKKDKPVYNNIKWGNSMTDSAGGAVELAKKFAQEKGYTNVTSTLIYGVQWDAVMQFIDNNYIEGTIAETSYIRNSTGKGNYTGTNENYKMKNIYDMAGNAWEWTMEASSIYTYRLARGGTYYNNGYDVTASGRGNIPPYSPQAFVTLRTALYL